jgi:hypothetical protein
MIYKDIIEEIDKCIRHPQLESMWFDKTEPSFI